MNLELLEQAVLNQIEADLNDNDFEAYSEKNIEILYQYLSDTAQQNLKEDKTAIRY